MIGMIAITKVVTRLDYYSYTKLLQPSNRKQVTSIKCIGVSGYILLLYIIFKAKRYISGQLNDLPSGQGIDISPNGWTTNTIRINQLLRRFIPATKAYK